MKTIIFYVFLASTLFVVNAFALPTQSAKSLNWEYPVDTEISGFYLYFAPQAEPTPRSYIDANKISVPPEKRSVVLLSVSPSASGELCFKMTAFQTDLNGAEKESAFTDEACGDFGLIPVKSFVIE